MPDERTRRLAAQFAVDRAQIDNRRMLGDDVARPRDVEHFAYFPTADAAQRAVEQLEKAGFTGSTYFSADRSSLMAARSDAVDEESARAFVREVDAIVEANGGHYDGWGAPVVVARRPMVHIPDTPAEINWG